jgi:hypothetical protein
MVLQVWTNVPGSLTNLIDRDSTTKQYTDKSMAQHCSTHMYELLARIARLCV